MIGVYIVTEVRTYREALEQALALTGCVRIVGRAAYPCDALPELGPLAPDVVLLDLADEGPYWARELGEVSPDVRVIVLGVRETEEEVIAWAEAGVAGYVGLEACLRDMVAAIEGVMRGEAPCPPRTAAFLLRRIAAGPLENAVPASADRRLSVREGEILRLIGQGLSNQQIARCLFISLSTVKNHVHNILEKLGVHRRADAVREMRRAGSALRARTNGHRAREAPLHLIPRPRSDRKMDTR
jgi:DNA-binding NarL/FixJ family response regulator